MVSNGGHAPASPSRVGYTWRAGAQQRCTVLLGAKIYDVRCVDVPHLADFPASSLGTAAARLFSSRSHAVPCIAEWDTCGGLSVRRATAYVLAYDAEHVEQTFPQVYKLHSQIRQCRPNAPVSAHSMCVADERSRVQIVVVALRCDRLRRGEKCLTHVAETVRKQWRCPHIECSAHENWHVNALLKEVRRSSIAHSSKVYRA